MSRYDDGLRQTLYRFVQSNDFPRWAHYRHYKNTEVDYQAIFQSAALNRLPWDAIEPVEQAANSKKFNHMLYVYIADRLQDVSKLVIPNACIVVAHPVMMVYSK